MKLLLLAGTLVILASCGNSERPANLQQPISSTLATRFVMLSSGSDVFLLNSETGKVWKYDASKAAFLEVPITSEIVEYEKGPDGKLRRKQPDPKDPLGILEKPSSK